jgi:hypothetical protein
MTVLEQAKHIREAMDCAGAVLTDGQALNCKVIYKQWKDLVEVGAKVKKGYRFLYDKDLYRAEQPEYTFAAQHVPGSTGTESLFSRIDDTHAGTYEDPIPYDRNMEIYQGSYYSQYGTVYLCIRSSGQPLQHDLAALVGNFVEVA